MLTRRRVVVALALALFVGAVLFVRMVHPLELARLGAGYGAKQTCSCHFVSGRPIESCRRDLDPLAQRLVSFQLGDAEVTASTLGIAAATAKHEPGFGCVLVD